MASPEWMRSLSDVDLPDAPRFGNKAAMLGSLARHGHDVPDGYVISAECLDELLERNGFPWSPDDYLACSSEIRDRLSRYSLGPELSGALRACADRLHARYAADRIIVRACADLRSLFEHYRRDAIIEARLLRARTASARTLLDLLSEYGLRYGWLYGGNLEEGTLPAPGAVPRRECIGRLRRYLHVDLDEYNANLARVSENNRRLRETGLSMCRTDGERQAFRMAVRAGEKAFLAGDDHAFFICSRKYVYVCDALRRIADRFAEVHVIDSTDDIRFLSLSEIRMHLRGGGPVRGDAARRREEYLARCRLLPPKTIGAQRPPDPASAESTRAAPSGIIKGQPGTKKDARGKIHIGFPRSPPEEDVVLLLEHGHEGDLSTILGRVRGIILKMGTPACHMGIIARELGIPAVYGVGHQADALCHGQVVEINGETGEVVAVPAR